MGAHRRPTPINPEQRRLIVTESAPPPEQVGSGQRLAGVDPTCHVRGIIDRKSRFALHSLKHRGITDSGDKACGGHMTEAMRQLYDHSLPVVKAAVKPKKDC